MAKATDRAKLHLCPLSSQAPLDVSSILCTFLQREEGMWSWRVHGGEVAPESTVAGTFHKASNFQNNLASL